MDNVWAALALIFAGAFFATLIIALFYWVVVRPRLLALREPPTAPADLAALNEQTQQAVQTLSETLVRHSALLSRLPTSFEIRGPSLPPVEEAEPQVAEAPAREAPAAEPSAPGPALDAETRHLLDSVQALAIALNEVKQHGVIQLLEQRGLLDDLQQVLGELAAYHVQTSAQLTAHGDRLSAQQEALLHELRERYQDLTAQGTRHSAQLTAHGDRIAAQQEDLRAELQEQHQDLAAQSTRHSAQLTAHGDRITGQQEHWLAELRELLQGINAAQMQHSAQLTAQGDRLASALDAATAAAQAPGEAAPAASDDLLAALTQMREETTRQRRAADEVQTQLQRVAERLDLALQGQQTQMALLDALVNRAPPSDRLVIREEKMLLQDRLTDIKGIGPVYAGRLHDAGIHSFRQLATLNTEELFQVLDRRAASDEWAHEVIQQAQWLADQRDKAEDAL